MEVVARADIGVSAEGERNSPYGLLAGFLIQLLLPMSFCENVLLHEKTNVAPILQS
jgi:hypothetical protein